MRWERASEVVASLSLEYLHLAAAVQRGLPLPLTAPKERCALQRTFEATSIQAESFAYAPSEWKPRRRLR